MTSENYRMVLNNTYKNRELTPADFDNTLMHFAMLFSKEQGGTVTEEDGGTEYGVESDEFDKVMPIVEPRLEDGDTVNITANESTIKEEDEEEIDSLYSGADDRAIEYGIQNEEFDKLMKELKESGRPSIKVNESVNKINAKIKKSDLINYIKNKR